jgi:hypothetical protein
MVMNKHSDKHKSVILLEFRFWAYPDVAMINATVFSKTYSQ